MARRDAVDVTVSEVGPREGAQSLDVPIPTDTKCRWIDALAAAGLREIEVGAFVSPKRLPQMADAAELVEHAKNLGDVNVLALTPNVRGAENAVAAGCRALTMPVSVSRSHSIANIGMLPAEAVEQVRQTAAFLANTAPEATLEVGLSTAFGCSIEGRVPEDDVIALAVDCAEAGAMSVGLSDTAGSANPTQVQRLFTRLRSELGDRAGGAHLHNTRGQGLANVVAALNTGVTTLDSSQAGLGGCPYAPGASGNIVTEDLVYLLESMGLRTGIDLDLLLAAREILAAGLPDVPLYGHVVEAGPHKGFTYANGERA